MNVLLVEDDELLGESIAETLSSAGFRALSCASGEDGLVALGREPIAVAIVDYYLGGMGGSEFTRRSRKVAPDIPIIGISGRLGAERDLMAAGACCFIQKPFDGERLLRAVRWALEVYGRE